MSVYMTDAGLCGRPLLILHQLQHLQYNPAGVVGRGIHHGAISGNSEAVRFVGHRAQYNIGNAVLLADRGDRSTFHLTGQRFEIRLQMLHVLL